MKLETTKLDSTRFAGDRQRLTGLLEDPDLGGMLKDLTVLDKAQAMRRQLLANAVRIDVRYLPDLDACLERLRGAVGIESPMEAYVYADPRINAAIVQGRTHIMIVLSSGAVNDLTPDEMEFVIGHELGHAVHGHLEHAVAHLVQSGAAGPRQAMDLLAWSRAAEISADRAGVICCNSVHTAANAMYKTISGLGRVAMKVDPTDFAEQWDHLVEEVVTEGEDEYWHLTHPFPPLRMKAMNLFWEHWKQSGSPDEINGDALARVDAEIMRLLGLMDPNFRERKDSTDPFLERFILWGGLYVAAVDGTIDKTEIKRLASLVPQDQVETALAEPDLTASVCLEKFGEALEQRRKKLTALEMHRVLTALVSVAWSDGNVDDSERKALLKIASQFGVPDRAVTLLIDELAGQEA